MRVAGRGRPPLKPGETGTAGLPAPEGTLKLPVRAVWMRRKGLRGWEMGFEFVDIDRARQRAVENLALYGFLKAAGGGTGDESNAPPGPGRDAQPEPREEPNHALGRTATIEEPDYYEILGVGPNSDAETVRAAFRALARRLHPDVNRGADAPARFQLAKQAYDTLRDPAAKAAYDERRAGRSAA